MFSPLSSPLAMAEIVQIGLGLGLAPPPFSLPFLEKRKLTQLPADSLPTVSLTPFYLPLFAIFKMCQKTSLLPFDFDKAFDSLLLRRRTFKILNSFLQLFPSLSSSSWTFCPFLLFPVLWWMHGRTDALTGFSQKET